MGSSVHLSEEPLLDGTKMPETMLLTLIEAFKHCTGELREVRSRMS
jgi:hypothetical protein